jgi:hypothetical protein
MQGRKNLLKTLEHRLDVLFDPEPEVNRKCTSSQPCKSLFTILKASDRWFNESTGAPSEYMAGKNWLETHCNEYGLCLSQPPEDIRAFQAINLDKQHYHRWAIRIGLDTSGHIRFTDGSKLIITTVTEHFDDMQFGAGGHRILWFVNLVYINIKDLEKTITSCNWGYPIEGQMHFIVRDIDCPSAAKTHKKAMHLSAPENAELKQMHEWLRTNVGSDYYAEHAIIRTYRDESGIWIAQGSVYVNDSGHNTFTWIATITFSDQDGCAYLWVRSRYFSSSRSGRI